MATAIAEGAPPRRKNGRTMRQRVAIWARWLHIYLSMFGLAAVFFFSATGVTLNHPDWFFSGAQDFDSTSGELDLALLETESVNRLEIVEELRATHGIGGKLSSFTEDDYECVVVFKGPGYSADAFIDRESGSYTLTESFAGVVAVMNDLHKGRDTGAGWSLVIDITSVLLCVSSATGLLLILYIKRRRRSGLVMAAGGLVVTVLVYVWFVP